ncbi:PREDICTED: zinc finger CCCH domain-containing protein 39-like isoform X2 [Nelumbo nucifera]|uniref:Zinc finger CCCH domain-containing protein 39-like isoform X2 n=1 Tax=Nelumbo nucifera TaxID=4432 RepID=A0A1U7ZYR4_NELNU|nr:PREDICTED: zinc finger CCCH domain-containing protein 39-like isoform X2 [Nelumbo nucifera]
MSVPAPPPSFFMPPFAAGGDAIGFWPQLPVDNENSEPASRADFPPLKRPRSFEDVPSNSLNNPLPNPRVLPPNPPVNKGISRIFFKTRLCSRFKAGTCPYGSNCNFAHGIDDIRKPPPNWQEIVAAHAHEEDRAAGNWDEDQRIISKLKLCKKFCSGEECPYGERCNFLHEDPSKFREDSGRFRESSAISIGTTGSPGGNGTGVDQQEVNGSGNSSFDVNRMNPKPVFWKTRICNKWETTGHCPFELQKYGGHTEVESGNAGTFLPKPLPNLAQDVSPTSTVIGATSKQQVQGKKCLLKWKGPEKISRIYADWIDDLPLAYNSPNKVES